MTANGKFTKAQKAELSRGFEESRAAYEADRAALIEHSQAVHDLYVERFGKVSDWERELQKIPARFKREKP